MKTERKTNVIRKPIHLNRRKTSNESSSRMEAFATRQIGGSVQATGVQEDAEFNALVGMIKEIGQLEDEEESEAPAALHAVPVAKEPEKKAVILAPNFKMEKPMENSEISTATTKSIYPQQVARGLIAMKRLTVGALATSTGITQNSLIAFLQGNDAALTEQSFETLFRFLGIVPTEDGARLASDRVHFLHLNLPRFGMQKAIETFQIIFPLVDSLSAMELPEKKGVTPIFIRSENVRICLFLRKPAFSRIGMSDLGLAPGMFKGHDKTKLIPEYYAELIMTEQVKPNYFDLILEGDFQYDSIEALKVVALEHDVTIRDITEWITGHARDGEMKGREVLIQDENTHHYNRVVSLFPAHFASRKVG